MIKSGILIAGILLITLTIFAIPAGAQGVPACGDVNDDAVVNISDAIYIIGYLFIGGDSPHGEADVDQCGSINISDVVYIFDYVFKGGPAPCEGSVDCILPTNSNSITLGCPVEVNANDGSFSVPVYLTSDTPINGFSFGFKYNSPDIDIASIDPTGSVLDSGFMLNFAPDPSEQKFKVFMLAILGDLTPLEPQNNALLFTLNFNIIGGASAQEIDIDTTSEFIGPDIEFILSPEGGGSIKPNYIDCGTSDIIISEAEYICGDANSDQKINIVDAVYIIRYIFQGGNPPDFMAAADVNCDGEVNVSDAIWIINYIFLGDNAPCDVDGDGIPDC